MENFIDYVNLIGSGPGIFAVGGRKNVFLSYGRYIVTQLFSIDLLFYLGVVFPLGHECILTRLLCISWRRNETCNDNF